MDIARSIVTTHNRYCSMTAARLRLLLVIALFLMGGLPGCMTIASQSAYWSGSGSRGDSWMYLCFRRLWIYGGTVNDACWISKWSGGSILFLIDLPLSLAADTVLLPLTVVQQLTDSGEEESTERGDGSQSPRAPSEPAPGSPRIAPDEAP